MKISKAFLKKVPNFVMKRELEEVIYPSHMLLAFIDLGVKETTPANQRIKEYFAGLGLDLDQKTSWCGAFAAFCLSRTYPTFKVYPELCQSQEWLKVGRLSALQPSVGDIVIFSNHNGKGGHVGFYVDETENSILVLGGNQKDEVNYTWFKKNGKTMYLREIRRFYGR